MMGRMIDVKEFNMDGGLNPEWFFMKVSCHGQRRFSFNVEEEYKFPLYVHDWRRNMYYSEECIPKVEMRRFTERYLEGDVKINQKDMSYKAHGCDPYYPITIDHQYTAFNFELDTDRALFKLRFAEFLDELSEYHPLYGSLYYRRWEKPV